MALGADNGQTAGGTYGRRQLDIGTTTGHVGGDGHGSRLSGLGHDFGLALVQLGVQHVVFDFAQGEHTAQQLRYFDRGGTHEHGTSGLDHLHNLFDNGVVLGPLGLVDAVLHIDTGYRLVGRDSHHIEFIDVPELTGFGLGGTGHTGQLVIHAEVVLQGDGGEGLRSGFDLHVLLGFDGLVQTVGIAAALHDTAGLLVDDFHLVVDNHILVVEFEEGIGLQQLVDGVNPLGLDGIILQQFVLAVLLLLGREPQVFKVGKLFADVGQHEEVGVVRFAGHDIDTLIGQVDAVIFLVDDEIEVIGNLGHTTVVVGHIDGLGLEHQRFDTRLAQIFDEGSVLGQTLETAVEQHGTLFARLLVVRSNLGLGLGQQLRNQGTLHLDQLLDLGLELFEHLVVALGGGTRNNQRGTGIVDQHRVDLVDNSVVVHALYQVERRTGHVVTQVVETELVVGSEGNIGIVGIATGLGVGFVLVDAVDRQAVEHVERPHPLRVTFRQVVVDRHHMHAVARKGVKEYRQRSHQRLTFTGSHLGNFSLMQHHATNQLHVVVYHVPHHFVTTGHPVVHIDGFIALDVDEIVVHGQATVKVVGRHLDGRIVAEPAGGLLHDGKNLGKRLVEYLFNLFQNLLFDFVNLFPGRFAFVIVERLDMLFKLGHALTVGCDRILNVLLDYIDTMTQFIVCQRFEFGRYGLYLLDIGLNLFQVALRLVAEHLFQ